jgi:hypothetical protein
LTHGHETTGRVAEKERVCSGHKFGVCVVEEVFFQFRFWFSTKEIDISDKRGAPCITLPEKMTRNKRR